VSARAVEAAWRGAGDPANQTMRPAVFLDRDGTLIEEGGYLERIERLTFFPYSVDSVRLLNDAGFAVVIVTNQAGIARGIVSEAFVGEASRHIAGRIELGGGRIDGFYHCPHHPDGIVEALRVRCDCRKPEPGMLKRAARDLGLDLARSFVVGDRWHDLQAGTAVGARGVLVRTGYGRSVEAHPPAGVVASAVVDNLAGAVSWILREA
jgi:D-glycero-D-manno-heptose 1,7-bisphosphate phosphatase